MQLEGRLKLDEPVEYNVHKETGELSFLLTERTRRLLRRFRTSLDGAGYEVEKDEAWVVVWPPLPLSVRIRLHRITVDQRQHSDVGSVVPNFLRRPKLVTMREGQ